MSLKALAQQTLARLAGEMEHETCNETMMKQVKQDPVSCFIDPGACFTPVKHGEPQKTAISGSCFTVSFPRGETHETSAVSAWRACVDALNPAATPPQLSPERWRQMIDDADRFLSRCGRPAVALGWTEFDLFGVSPRFARRLDRDGLLYALEGRQVIAMTAAAATIDAVAGNATRYYRMDRPGAVTWWSTAHEGLL